MTLRVNVEYLAASGVAVNGHGEDVATNYAAAANRIDAAQGGWQGASAAALAVLSERWTRATNGLITRLSDHAQGLHACAQGFAEMEERHSQAFAMASQSSAAIVSQKSRWLFDS